MPDETKATPPAEVRDHRALPGRGEPATPADAGVTGAIVPLPAPPGDLGEILGRAAGPPARPQPGQEERRCSD